MLRTDRKLLALIGIIFACAAHAQSTVYSERTHGTLVIVPALGEVTHANDQAYATFQLEEQDKDKSVAASRANEQMKQGIAILKREDPAATLKTRGYHTYPIYSDSNSANKPRQPIGWRIDQYVELTTTSLDSLPHTVAAVQQLLTLNGLQFGLAPATAKKLDQQEIEAAYQNLSERIASIAKAMGRTVDDAVLDTVDFEGSGAYAEQPMREQARFAPAAMVAQSIEEPSFEPGETTRQLRIIGKLKFK